MKYLIYQERDDAIGYINNNFAKELKGFKHIKISLDDKKYLNHIKDVFLAFKIALKCNKHDTLLLTNAKSLTAYILNWICRAKKFAIFYHVENDIFDKVFGYKRLLNNFNILTPSISTVNELDDKGIKNIDILEIPCDREFKRLKAINKTKDLIYVGSFAKRKNIKNILRAIDYLNNSKRFRVNLTIVNGYGRGYQQIKDYIKFMDIKPYVKIKRNLDKYNLVIEYNKHKALLYPTFKEGLGLPLIEAAKCGCAIITSNIIHHKLVTLYAGLYANPNNYKAIAEIIEKLFKDKDNMHKYQERAKEINKHYKWENTVNKITELLK